jgi:hypothetical protein
MKIAIGINIFGECPRQKKCIEVLKKIASKYSNIILYNIIYPNEKNLDDAFIALPLLKQKVVWYILEMKMIGNFFQKMYWFN